MQSGKMNPRQVTVCLLLVGIATIGRSVKNSGPVGDIQLYRIAPCDPVDKGIELSLELKTTKADEQEICGSIKLAYDIKDDVEFVFTADKWEMGQWKEDAFSTDGNMFNFLNERLALIWENIRKAVTPPLSENDFIPAGEYTINCYREVSENCELPQILYGKFRVTIKIYIDDEVVGCLEAEADSIE